MLISKLTILYGLLLLQAATVQLYEAWVFEKSKRWINRKWLVRPINKKRLSHGHLATLFQETKSDPYKFFQYTRMDVPTFNYLISLVQLYLKSRTRIPDVISTEEKLAVTLRYLTTADEILSIALEYRIGESTVYRIIKETCRVLHKILMPTYLRPLTAPVWRNISQGFLYDWNLPNCCGAIDGKHIGIKSPSKSGSLYFNYKKFHSIVLLAMFNHRYEFIFVDVGAYGSESDGGVLARSEFGKALFNSYLNLSQENTALPKTNIKLTYYFVGDEAFKMIRNLMRPYPGRHLDKERRIFNYRLSRARRCIESAFGILTARWRVFFKPIGFHPKDVSQIVLATICLHNFLMAQTQKSIRRVYCTSELINSINETEVLTNEEDNISVQNLSDEDVQKAYATRDTLAQYFLTPQGAVDWQDEYIGRGRYQDE